MATVTAFCISVTNQLETTAVEVHVSESVSLQLLLFHGGERIASVFPVYRFPSGRLLELIQSFPISTIIVGNTSIDFCHENILSSGRIEYETLLNSILASIM